MLLLFSRVFLGESGDRVDGGVHVERLDGAVSVYLALPVALFAHHTGARLHFLIDLRELYRGLRTSRSHRGDVALRVGADIVCVPHRS